MYSPFQVRVRRRTLLQFQSIKCPFKDNPSTKVSLNTSQSTNARTPGHILRTGKLAVSHLSILWKQRQRQQNTAVVQQTQSAVRMVYKSNLLFRVPFRQRKGVKKRDGMIRYCKEDITILFNKVEGMMTGKAEMKSRKRRKWAPTMSFSLLEARASVLFLGSRWPNPNPTSPWKLALSKKIPTAE